MSDRERFWCVGHRGSPVFEPENTIASFERAVCEDGANGLELDLCMTKDGAIVVWHDWSPHRAEALCRESGYEPSVRFRPLPPQSGPLRRAIDELYLDDVQRHFGYALKEGPRQRIESAPVITFDELLARACRWPTLEMLFLDVKIPKKKAHLAPVLVERVERALAARPVACHVVYETDSRRVLEEMKRALPCARDRSFSLDIGPLLGLRPGVLPYSAVQRAIEYSNTLATSQRPRKCCLRPWATYRKIAEHDVALLRRHNAACALDRRIHGLIGFTINVAAEMEELLRLGMNGLVTDRPDRLTRVLDAHGQRADQRLEDEEPSRISLAA